MGTDREVRGLQVLLLAALLSWSVAVDVRAHALNDGREAIVSVEDHRVQVLLIHEIPAGDEARQLRAMVAWERAGVHGVLSRAVLQQYVLPRALDGFQLLQDMRALPLRVADISFRDGAGRTPASRGILAAVLLEAELGEGAIPGGWTRITLSIDPDTAPTRALLQVEGAGWELVSSDPPPQEEGLPAAGPLLMRGSEALSVLLRRRATPPH